MRLRALLFSLYKKVVANQQVRDDLAGDEGFEPPQTESESGVLPLHKSPKWPLAEAHDYYNDFSQKVKTNFFFFAEIKSKRKSRLRISPEKQDIFADKRACFCEAR